MRGGAAFLLLAFGLAGCAGFDEATSSGPPPGFAGYKVAVMPGESVDELAHRFGVSPRGIIEANHLEPPYALMAHQVLIIPPPATYRVKSGDTVAGIATMLGVDEYALAQANGLSEPYEMRVGQVLRVPGGIGGAGSGTEMAEAGPELPVESAMHRPAISASALPPPPGVAAGPGSAPAAPPSAPAFAAPPPAAASAAPTSVVPPQSARTALSSPTALAPQPPQRIASAAPPQPVVALPAAPVPAASPPTPAPSAAPSNPPSGASSAAPVTTAMAAPAPAHAAAGAPRFLTPVKGEVVGHFGPDSSGQKNDGINIAAPAGTPVAAADSGTVIYAGNELPAFGNLVMVRHAGGWVTAYGHLASISVQRGASVTRGETVGTVGQTGSVSSPQLHFEIRQGSQPVDPTPYLSGKS